MKVKDIIEKHLANPTMYPYLAGPFHPSKAAMKPGDCYVFVDNLCQLDEDDVPVCWVHGSSCIDEGAEIGQDTHIWHFCHVMPKAKIGARCNIGQNCFIDNKAIVGDGCKLQNNVSVYKFVELGDDVFVGPSAVFTNVTNPRSQIKRSDSEYAPTLVKRGATIGANATIICGAKIESYAMVGAGSIVGGHAVIPRYAIVYGSPLRVRGYMCVCGETFLTFQPRELGSLSGLVEVKDDAPATAHCEVCKRRYTEVQP